MKLPANLRAQVSAVVASQPTTAIVVRPSDALATVADNPLLTREDRLRWLRDFATGAMTFTKYVRGMQAQVAADAPLRLRAVEVLARIEGDLKESPFAGMNVGQVVFEMPSNGRSTIVDAKEGGEE